LLRLLWKTFTSVSWKELGRWLSSANSLETLLNSIAAMITAVHCSPPG